MSCFFFIKKEKKIQLIQLITFNAVNLASNPFLVSQIQEAAVALPLQDIQTITNLKRWSGRKGGGMRMGEQHRDEKLAQQNVQQ